MGNELFEAGNFSVRLAKFTDPVLAEEVEGYGIVNTVTGVREAECRRLATAISFASQFHQEELDRAAREFEEEQAGKEFPVIN